jgi:hypothetical protein
MLAPLTLHLNCHLSDWFYGHASSAPLKRGIFPKNYVRIFDKKDLAHAYGLRSTLSASFETMFSFLINSDPSVAEIDALLKEWINVWSSKYEECEASKMISIMGFFKNLYNVRNIIIANRASIVSLRYAMLLTDTLDPKILKLKKDEIKDHKKSAIDKILQCNNLLGLDVIAYDSSYNLLDPFRATTIYLFNELKKNSFIKANVINKSVFHPSLANDELSSQFSDSNTTFSHQLPNPNLQMQNGSTCVRANSVTSRASINQNQYRQSQSAFYIKLTIENIRPSENVSIDENVQFYVNMFMNKENFYLRLDC